MLECFDKFFFKKKKGRSATMCGISLLKSDLPLKIRRRKRYETKQQAD